MTAEAIVAITVPKWGMSMEEGTVTAWHVEVGQAVEPGDEVLDVESEKIASAIEARAGGVLRRIVAPVGATRPVGALLGVIAGAEVSDEAVERFVATFVVTTSETEASSGPSVRTVEANGRAIRCLVHGEGGSPLILVHGFGGDANAWLLNHTTLGAKRSVYALELPGHGGSSKDVGDGGVEVLGSAVLAVLEAAGESQVHLVGHSLGGAAALWAASQRPARVATLSLIAPVGLGAEIDGEYIAGFVAAGRRKEMKPLVQRLFADPSVVTRQLVENLLRSKRIDGVDAALATIATACFEGNRQKIDLAASARALEIPVQVIWGREDRIIPCAHGSVLADAALHLLEDAGHMPMMEQASRVNALLETFIERH